jgi:hypothetical protein
MTLSHPTSISLMAIAKTFRNQRRMFRNSAFITTGIELMLEPPMLPTFFSPLFGHRKRLPAITRRSRSTVRNS